ncbi:hypothetical protein B4914_13965 [Yersinia entomophaga]|nr:hypothetical protein B4914_13965 [Yersinia entomophaga]
MEDYFNFPEAPGDLWRRKDIFLCGQCEVIKAVCPDALFWCFALVREARRPTISNLLLIDLTLFLSRTSR